MGARDVARRLKGGDAYVATLAATAAVLFAVLGATMPDRFLDSDNLASMAAQLSELGMFSLGMTLSLLIGGIDLSVVAVANVSAILGGLVIQAVAPGEAAAGQVWLALAAAVAVALATGAAAGLLNGVLIARVGVPSILATLGTMTLIAGLALGITNGSAISGLPERLVDLGNAGVLGVPVPFLLFLALWLFCDVIVRRSVFGTNIVLIGTSLKVARFSGIAAGRSIIGTYVLSALVASLAGLMSLLRTNSAHADYGGSYVLLAILASVLGGVSVAGGAGRFIGVLLALVILQLLSTGFNMLLLFVPDGNFFRDFIWGVLLLLIMAATNTGHLRRR